MPRCMQNNIDAFFIFDVHSIYIAILYSISIRIFILYQSVSFMLGLVVYS
jgi:hypothetical protein